MSDIITRHPGPSGLPLSKAVRVGPFLFLSGQVPMDDQGQLLHGDIKEQTKAVLDRIVKTLDECGASLADVVKANVWLSDIGDFPLFNDVYAAYFKDGFPARSTVQAKLAGGVGVEIEVQAWLG